MSNVTDLTRALIELKNKKISLMKQRSELHDKMHNHEFVSAREFKKLDADIDIIKEEMDSVFLELEMERALEREGRNNDNARYAELKADFERYRRIIRDNLGAKEQSLINKLYSNSKNPQIHE